MADFKRENAPNENALENSGTEASSSDCVKNENAVENSVTEAFSGSSSDCVKNESAHNENAVEDSGLEAFGGSSSVSLQDDCVQNGSAHNENAVEAFAGSSSGKKKVVNGPFDIFPMEIWIKIGLLLDDVELVPFLAALEDLNMLQFPTYRTPTIPSLPEELRIEAVLSERIVYQVQQSCSSKGWLVKLERTSNQKFRAFDPISLCVISRVCFRKINMLEYRFVQIQKTHAVQFRCQHENDQFTCFEKAALISDPSLCKECTVCCKGKLFIRDAAGSWSCIERLTIHDLICFKGGVFVVEENGVLARVDSKTMALLIRSPAIPMDSWNTKKSQKHLVQSSNTLYLVDRLLDGIRVLEEFDADDQIQPAADNFVKYGFSKFNTEAKTVDMKVYKLSKHEWVRVRHLEDKTFFLSPEGSFSVEAADFFANPVRNAIYFNDYVPASGRHLNIRVFDTQHNSIVDHISTRDLNIFRPHPKWLAYPDFSVYTTTSWR